MTAEKFRERVFRIDLLEFAPDATGPVDLAEMTESRSKYGAAKIRFGSEDNLAGLKKSPGFRTQCQDFSTGVYCSPVLRHSAGLIQAANFRSAVVF